MTAQVPFNQLPGAVQREMQTGFRHDADLAWVNSRGPITIVGQTNTKPAEILTADRFGVKRDWPDAFDAQARESALRVFAKGRILLVLSPFSLKWWNDVDDYSAAASNFRSSFDGESNKTLWINIIPIDTPELRDVPDLREGFSRALFGLSLEATQAAAEAGVLPTQIGSLEEQNTLVQTATSDAPPGSERVTAPRQGQRPPIQLQEIEQSLNHPTAEPILPSSIKEVGIDFDLTQDALDKLRRAGAWPALIEALRKARFPFELSSWRSIERSNYSLAYRDYLREYPIGIFAAIARRRLEQ